MEATRILLSEDCSNLEEYLLLWINISLKEFNIAQSRLRSSFNHQKLFNDQSQCEKYISHHVSKDDRIVFIIHSMNICQDFLLRIQQLRQVSSIYILCSYEDNSEELTKIWSKQFTKIRSTFAEIDKLITKIEFDQYLRRNRDIDTALAFNVFNIDNNQNTDRSSLDLNAEFLHSLLVIDVLLRMKKLSIDPHKDLIDLCKNAYKDNAIELNNIENFARTYTFNQALLWYTSNTFLFRILNKAFRVNNTYLLYLFRSFIFDLHCQLQQNQCTSPIHVYLGHLMTTDELDHLLHSVDRYISIKSFFSTSLKYDLALFYLGSSDVSNMNLKRILFEIDADPKIDRIKPFAKIAQFSAFPNEQEVLFMPRSIFKIIDISFDHENIVHMIRMVLCSEKHNHLNEVYQQNRNDYGGGWQKETNPMTLGNVLQRMSKYDEAEMFYHQQLNELYVDNVDNRLISACYFNIAEVLREKDQYDTSMIWYQKLLDIDIKTLPDGHPNIGNTYNSIGIVQEKKVIMKRH